MNPDQLGCIRLISACARDTRDEILWCEFLKRYSSSIKQFVARVCASRSRAGNSSGTLTRAIQPSDLYQSVIVRLVEHNCAAMKAFAGTTEEEWLAYLAIITRSVVCELLRFRVRSRISGATVPFSVSARFWSQDQHYKRNQPHKVEQGVLATEVKTICERMIRNLAGDHSSRDLLIFHLYFSQDMSISQIAACKGVNLTASGVKKVIHEFRRRVRNVVTSDTPQIARQNVCLMHRWRRQPAACNP